MRDKIFSHRKEELWAYGAYARARRRLWTFLSDFLLQSFRVNDNPQQPRHSEGAALGRFRKSTLESSKPDTNAFSEPPPSD
jgi:hypothetical protein